MTKVILSLIVLFNCAENKHPIKFIIALSWKRPGKKHTTGLPQPDKIQRDDKRVLLPWGQLANLHSNYIFQECVACEPQRRHMSCIARRAPYCHLGMWDIRNSTKHIPKHFRPTCLLRGWFFVQLALQNEPRLSRRVLGLCLAENQPTTCKNQNSELPMNR